MTSFSTQTIKTIPTNNQNCINFIKTSNFTWWISKTTGEFMAIVPKKFNPADFLKSVSMSAKEQVNKINNDISFIKRMTQEILNQS